VEHDDKQYRQCPQSLDLGPDTFSHSTKSTAAANVVSALCRRSGTSVNRGSEGAKRDGRSRRAERVAPQERRRNQKT
jgi:hypothetical protein